jgi:Polynucleotide kinase 3 phosphatase
MNCSTVGCQRVSTWMLSIRTRGIGPHSIRRYHNIINMSASKNEHGGSSSSVKRKRDHPRDSPGSSQGVPRPDAKVPKRASAQTYYTIFLEQHASLRSHGGPSFADSLSSVFPIFEKRRVGDEGAEEQKPFRWLKPPPGATRSCLLGVHLSPTASERVAAFDLDGTVIKSRFIQVGRAGGKQQRVVKRQANGLEWEWWRAVVPQKLKEAHDSGCVLLFFLYSDVVGVLYLISIDAQVLCCADVEPVPQVLRARRMEEKDSIDCRCSAYLSQRHSPSFLDFCA